MNDIYQPSYHNSAPQKEKSNSKFGVAFLAGTAGAIFGILFISILGFYNQDEIYTLLAQNKIEPVSITDKIDKSWQDTDNFKNLMEKTGIFDSAMKAFVEEGVGGSEEDQVIKIVKVDNIQR